MNAPTPLKPLPGTIGQSAKSTSTSPPSGNPAPQDVAMPKNVVLQPPSVLLQGASGAGKTHAIMTLLKSGLEVFAIITEPGGIESLLEACQKNNVAIDKLHWMECLPATDGFEALTTMTEDIGTKSFQALSQSSGIGKDKTRVPAYRLIKALQSFIDDRSGIDYGSFVDWDDTRALVVDSLSGVSIMAWYLTVGYKPTGAPGEWNVAMNWIETLLMKINSDRRCFFVLTAHIEKEMDEISGVNRIMTSTLGRKLAPKLSRFFSEVIYAKRVKEAPQFRWSNIDDQADLKNRSLPIGDKLDPDFGPIVKAYEVRKKNVMANVGTVTP